MTEFPQKLTKADQTAIHRNRQQNEMRRAVEDCSPQDVALFDGVASAFFVLMKFALSIIVNFARMQSEIRKLKNEKEIRDRNAKTF